MTKNKENKIYDHKTAFASAEAFYGLSQKYIEKIRPDIPNAYQRAIQDVGGLVASVTTLTLALELYIKVLHVLCDMPILATHHLWDLYKKLPDEIKIKIEHVYETRINNKKDMSSYDTATEFQLAIHVGPSPLFNSHEDGEVDPNEKKDIKSVLERSSDAFLTWRYLHEAGESGKWTYLRYEFVYLQTIAESLKTVILANINYIQIEKPNFD